MGNIKQAKKYVVFDWDGTLHDTKKLYAESVRRAYAYLETKLQDDDVVHVNRSTKDFTDVCKCSSQMGIVRKSKEELSEDVLSKYLGMTAKQMWDDFMPNLDQSLQKEAEKIVGDSMVELVYNKSAVLYSGVVELLDELKKAGYGLFILSNCKIAYLEAHRKVFELDKWFTGYYPAQKFDFIPKEEILKQIMTKYPGDYVMIGDRANDILAGKMCGVKTIGCKYGFGSFEELADADYLAKMPADIGELIAR